VLEVFRASRLRRGDNGQDDRKFLDILYYFTHHNITWRALRRKWSIATSPVSPFFILPGVCA
jgi:hypothetical protein